MDYRSKRKVVPFEMHRHDAEVGTYGASEAVMQRSVMLILLIEAGYIDREWLQQYFQDHDPSVQVDKVADLREAAEYVKHCKPDIILMDGRVPDALTPGAVESLIFTGEDIVPIVHLITGKTLHGECVRTPQTYVYRLKTDVTRDTFLKHLRQIVREVHEERMQDRHG